MTSIGNSVGCGWADYDNDGFPDLYLTRWFGQNNLFYTYDVLGGAFKDTSSKLLAISDGFSRNSTACTWGDFDNDGYVDLFIANFGGDGGVASRKNLLFRNNGAGTFTRVTAGAIANDIGNCLGSNWVDYDNDGYLDLFVANFGGPKFLYHNNGTGTFTRMTTGQLPTDTAAAGGCAWADYDNDGYLDLFVAAGSSGRNALYHNSRNGTFTKITVGQIVTENADSRSCAWGDYDNDGFLDLFVVNRSGVRNFLYHNNSNALILVSISSGFAPSISAASFSSRIAIG